MKWKMKSRSNFLSCLLTYINEYLKSDLDLRNNKQVGNQNRIREIVRKEIESVGWKPILGYGVSLMYWGGKSFWLDGFEGVGSSS